MNQIVNAMIQKVRRHGWALACLIAWAMPCGGCDSPNSTALTGDSSSANAANASPGEAPPASPATRPCCDWPQWRGPNRDGVSKETDWRRDDWPADGLPVVWSAAVGIGFSSVSTDADSCYTMGHEGELDSVWRLDAADGRVIWQHTYAAPLVDNLHEGGPAATPTLDGDRVYTVSKDGRFLCLDRATGAPIWTAEFHKLFDVKMPEWGFSCSPLVVDELVIVDAGCLAAFNKRTGELAWKTAMYRPGYGSPVVWRHGKEQLVVVLNNDVLLVARVADGGEVAQFPWKTDYATSACTPILDGDRIFISTGYDRGCVLLELRDNMLDKIYENKHMRNHMASCVLRDGFLYGFDGNSHNRRLVSLECMELATGEVRWKHRGLGTGTLLLSDDRLLVLGDEGQLLTVDASPDDFHERAHCQALEGRCWTMPTLSRGFIYCRSAAGELKCLDARLSAPAPGERGPRPAP